jgi:hypothetical protein
MCYQTSDYWDGKSSDLCLVEFIVTTTLPPPIRPLFTLAYCYESIDGTFEWRESTPPRDLLKVAKWRLVEEDTLQVSKKDIEKILFETAQTKNEENSVSISRLFEKEAEAIIRLIYSK